VLNVFIPKTEILPMSETKKDNRDSLSRRSSASGLKRALSFRKEKVTVVKDAKDTEQEGGVIFVDLKDRETQALSPRARTYKDLLEAETKYLADLELAESVCTKC
jgi:hypothetical protein